MQILEYGGLVTVLGLTIVFLVLILLVLVIGLMSYLLRLRNKKNAEAKPEQIPAQIFPGQVFAPSDEDGDEIAAAIAAALAVMTQQGGSGGGRLVVRCVRRVGATSPAWNRAGRLDATSKYY